MAGGLLTAFGISAASGPAEAAIGVRRSAIADLTTGSCEHRIGSGGRPGAVHRGTGDAATADLPAAGGGLRRRHHQGFLVSRNCLNSQKGQAIITKNCWTVDIQEGRKVKAVIVADDGFKSYLDPYGFLLEGISAILKNPGQPLTKGPLTQRYS